jgi:hypothetical protein
MRQTIQNFTKLAMRWWCPWMWCRWMWSNWQTAYLCIWWHVWCEVVQRHSCGTGHVQCGCYSSSALWHQTTLSWSKCVLTISNAQTMVEGRPRVPATLGHPSMSDLLLGRLLVVCFLEQIVLAANGWIKFSCNCWRSCKAMLDIEALLCY